MENNDGKPSLDVASAMRYTDWAPIGIPSSEQ